MIDKADGRLPEFYFSNIGEYQIETLLAAAEFQGSFVHPDCFEMVFTKPQNDFFISLLIYSPNCFKVARWTISEAGRQYIPNDWWR